VRPRITIENVHDHTFIRNWISKDSTIVDLGMNLGEFAWILQSNFRCRVFGVEANPHLAARLPQSESVRCYPMAVSGLTGVVKFYVDEKNTVASHIVQSKELDAGTESPSTIEVPSVSLAEFFHMNQIGRVDMLKVDVEGAELDIFEQTHPKVFEDVVQISVEFHAFLDPSVTPRIRRILARMERAGFYWMDFTRTYRDVLLINAKLVPLSFLDKLYLSIHKYRAGVPRKVRDYAHQLVQRAGHRSGT